MTVLPETRHIAEIIARLTKLSGSNPEPPQFFANFLQMTISATGSQGGAVWVLQPEKGPQCYCHLNVEMSKLEVPAQQDVFNQAIQKCIEENRSVVVPPMRGDANPGSSNNICGHCLIFKPLRAGGHVAMILQIICHSELSQDKYRAVVGIIDQCGETAETYLAHRRAVVLDDDRKSLSKLLNFSEKVHKSLDPEKVAYQIANLGRETIGCERLVVWVDPKLKRNLQAVSGIDKPDRRAVLMQAVDKLCRYCLREKKPLLAGRQQLVEMPQEQELTAILKNYFNISQLNQIYLYPMHIEEKYIGVLAAEGFEDSVTNLEGMITAVAGHGAVALENSLEMASMPVMKPLAGLKKIGRDPKRKRKYIVRSLVALIILVVCMFLPWSVRIKGECKLTPQVMRTLVCPLENGKVNDVLIKEGLVRAGNLIVQLDDSDLQIEARGLNLALSKEKVKNLQGSLSAVDKQISTHEIDRILNEIKLKQEMIDRCKIIAPIDGIILTPLLDRKIGDSLQRGEEICRVADLNSWQLVISVPQEDIEWVRLAAEGEVEADGEKMVEPVKVGPVKVDYVLEAFPREKLFAEITRPDQIAYSAQTVESGNVFEIRINLTIDQLDKVKRGLRDGMEGSAKISTVKRPLGFVLIRKVLRFFNLTFF